MGPDLTAMLVGAQGRFGRIDAAWLRVHRLGVERPTSPPFECDRDPAPNAGEQGVLDAIGSALERAGAIAE